MPLDLRKYESRTFHPEKNAHEPFGERGGQARLAAGAGFGGRRRGAAEHALVPADRGLIRSPGDLMPACPLGPRDLAGVRQRHGTGLG